MRRSVRLASDARVSRRSMRERITSVLAGLGLIAGLAVVAPEPAIAANSSDFSPGNLIADSVFYDGSAMSVAQIQAFLVSKVPSCAVGYTCLKDYRETTATRAPDAFCGGGYVAGDQQTAATIIWNVAQGCGVNPQVILVLLEKEQSLVTSTSPSAGRYRSATGYGCPDTAPCDAQYYGFFNQVYKAARQFKVYRAYPELYNHRAGRVNAIWFNPNTGCGAGNVFIENQATAGLYNYTPYQPNAAALANLYGYGDGCSSYGNRNFWRIFTDWFGDPRGGSLVRTASDPRVYMITENARYSVSTPTLYSSLAALGPARIVTPEYLNRFPLRTEAGNLLRDPASGSIYLAAYGQKNRFTTCEMVQRWGFGTACGAYIDITSGQQHRFATGTEITRFARSADTHMIYFIQDGKKRALHQWAQVVALATDGNTTFTNFPQSTLDLIPSGPDYLDPGTVVVTAADPTPYLVDGPTGAVRIDLPHLIGEFGLKPRVVVSDEARAAMVTAPNALRLAASCGAQNYIAGGGMIWPVPATSGLPSTVLDPSTCAALTTAPQTTTGGIFLRQPSTGAIFHITGGTKQHMTSMAQINTINGTNPLVLIPATDATLSSIPNH